MKGMKIENKILLLIACFICFIATGLQATEIEEGCLLPFSTDPGQKHPLSNEKSRRRDVGGDEQDCDSEAQEEEQPE